MIKIVKFSKRKNPHLNIEEYLSENSIEFKVIGRGAEGKILYFSINKNLIIDTKILNPGKYTLKIYYPNNKISLTKINKLILLSKYGLIPKIYIINNEYVISKYIEGIPFSKLKRSVSPYYLEEIRYKIHKQHLIWDKLGFNHGDLVDSNIIVSNDLKSVYFIDPYVEN